ncbi:hypothetical protein BC629DRAFT_1434252 [Irpex lacteus]|nr:hypothetical protein BC629DRAFT_1434252 [Irpex lacteus]
MLRLPLRSRLFGAKRQAPPFMLYNGVSRQTHGLILVFLVGSPASSPKTTQQSLIDRPPCRPWLICALHPCAIHICLTGPYGTVQWGITDTNYPPAKQKKPPTLRRYKGVSVNCVATKFAHREGRKRRWGRVHPVNNGYEFEVQPTITGTVIYDSASHSHIRYWAFLRSFPMAAYTHTELSNATRAAFSGINTDYPAIRFSEDLSFESMHGQAFGRGPSSHLQKYAGSSVHTQISSKLAEHLLASSERLYTARHPLERWAALTLSSTSKHINSGALAVQRDVRPISLLRKTCRRRGVAKANYNTTPCFLANEGSV